MGYVSNIILLTVLLSLTQTKKSSVFYVKEIICLKKTKTEGSLTLMTPLKNLIYGKANIPIIGSQKNISKNKIEKAPFLVKMAN